MTVRTFQFSIKLYAKVTIKSRNMQPMSPVTNLCIDCRTLNQVFCMRSNNYFKLSYTTVLHNLEQCKTRCNSTGCRRRLCLRLLWSWPLTFWPKN